MLIVLKKNSVTGNSSWIDLNEINIQSLLEDNKIIFVDITADWCVTCQYNKNFVIYTKEIQNLFEKFEVLQVQGDWTVPDENIRVFLSNYNTFGIPFNILYSPKEPRGVILPELITKKSIKDALLNTREE